MNDSGGGDLLSLADAVYRRRPVLLQRSHDGKPFDLFVARTGSLRWAGCKIAAPLTPGGSPVKSCLINASMIHGLLDQFQLSSEGVTLYVRPTHDEERADIFAELTSSPRNDIQYPFTRVFVDGRLDEPTSPPDYWVPSLGRVAELDDAEAPLRDHTLHVLSRYGIGGGRVFDPACSTGTFLAAVKSHFPHAWTIGQDLSEAMVRFADRRVDEVHHGDSIAPCVVAASVDVLVLRFLNVDVVSTQRAISLFDACARVVVPGGVILVMGHTPILVPSAYFEYSGFTVLERLGVTPAGGAAFQFYVLRRGAAQGDRRSS